MSGWARAVVAAHAPFLAALTLALAAPAHAASNLEIGMEDERLLLSSPTEAESAISAWAAAGVDVVRIHARWIDVSPGRARMHRPRGFDVANHRSRRYDWVTLDRAIDLTRSAGMRVMLSITGPGPLWTSLAPQRHNPRYKPSPRLFAQFARAVATRYRDRVDRYLIWNEPNVAGWLEPQQTCVARRVCFPASPHIYRGLVRAARPAIERADPGAQVLLGELAPRGHTAISTRSPVSPLPFLRELACVDRRYKWMRRGPCKRFRPARADAFGYHPHGVEFGPEDPNPDRDQAQIGDIPRLFAVLDRLTRMGRIGAPGRKFDVYLSEFSYQTSPPDHEVGISLGRQARYIQQAAYLAWRLPRVRNLTQYQWRDEPVIVRGRGVKSYSGWQSGLRYVNDRPKPAMRAFLEPFVIDLGRRGSVARFWGQIRPGTGVRTVTVLRLRPGQRVFRKVATVQTDARGFWTRRLPVQRRAKYRFSWEEAGATVADKPTRRLSGVVDLATDPARQWHASR
jgi:hypothetical protein